MSSTKNELRVTQKVLSSGKKELRVTEKVCLPLRKN